MSASYRFLACIRARLWPSRAAATLLFAGLVTMPSAGQALVRSPLTGELVDELPPAPVALPAPAALAPRGAGGGAVPGALYGTNGANLFLIDKTTGAATLIGPHGIPAAEHAIGSLGFGADGELYGTSLDTSATPNAKLYRINPATGAATAVGPLGLDFVAEGGLDFVCDAPRAANELDLDTGEMKAFTFDTGTGAGTRVGPDTAENRDLNGIAWDGTAFWAIDRITNTLGNLDFTTGAYAAVTSVKVGGVPIAIGNTGGLAADPATGTLYAAFSSTGGLYTLNKATGGATLIGVNNVAFGLAFAPLGPEPTPTPTPTPVPPVPLDHFMLYRAKNTSGTAKIPSFGPVTLADTFGSFEYDVKKMRRLGAPADKQNEGINDPDTHLTEYQIKPHRGALKFKQKPTLSVTDQFGTRPLKIKRPDALLVPTHKSTTSFPPEPVDAEHNVDHFLCYKVSGPKLNNLTVQVEDQFEDRQYALKKITRLCNPVSKSGTPVVQKGGAPFPITPSTKQNAERLVCYKAVSTSGPHTKRSGLFLAHQFGDERVDTVREYELCVPSIQPATPTPSPTPMVTPTPPAPCQTPGPPPPYGSTSRAFLEASSGLLD